MKRLLLILSLQLVVSVCMATITRVQSKAANTGNAAAASLTITLTSNATVGNVLFVGCSTGGSTTTASVKYGSNSWALILLANSSALGWFGYIPVAEVSNSIVVTPSASTGVACVAVEYSGANAIAGDIAALQATGSSTTNATGTTGTTNHANELVVAVMAGRATLASEQTAWLSSITNSFTSVAQTSTFINTSNNDREIAFLEKLVTSTGTQQVTGTQNNSTWSNVIATFYDAPTPTPTPTATFTPTATATATSTATATATATASFTPCAPTPTPTNTPTPTATATSTATPTNTPTPTPSATTTPCPPSSVIYGH